MFVEHDQHGTHKGCPQELDRYEEPHVPALDIDEPLTKGIPLKRVNQAAVKHDQHGVVHRDSDHEQTAGAEQEFVCPLSRSAKEMAPR